MNTVKKLAGGGSPRKKRVEREQPEGIIVNNIEELSPELVPIVTLLSSQSHRRYHEGIFMLYYDLNGDGKPADREWREVYGILTGNQLGYWDAANLVAFKDNPEGLLEASAKPKYINFTDSVYNAMRSLPAAKQNLDNVIIVSTTLKNRYILQFKSYHDLISWYSALRLSNYEYNSLQGAYTGALLSARGSRLSDIRTILAEKRFEHEDWVSIRYGSGMAWTRCFAVIEPSTSKKKSFHPGRVLFYENDQKKKKNLIAVVTNATSITAIYPQSHQLIDHSTMLKLDAYVNFKSPSFSTKISKKHAEDFKNASLFLMPEQHSSVPGFDTLIRFLIPLFDAFGLYGRPKRLKADRIDPESLLFGLPTLPRVHYLDINDVIPMTNSSSFMSWDAKQWTTNLMGIMKSKLDRGYEGCGSTRGVAGAITSLSSPSSTTFESSKSSKSLKSQNINKFSGETESTYSIPPSDSISEVQLKSLPKRRPAPLASTNDTLNMPSDKEEAHKSVQLADIYQKYSTLRSPSDQFHSNRNNLLNGSHEKLIEDELPENFRQLDLGPDAGMYPTNDDNLFSDDEDEDANSEIRSTNLVPPADNAYSNRNSSYSSVQSPMTQYHEFNQQLNSSLDRGIRNDDLTGDFSSDGLLSSLPPPPPPHQSFDYREKKKETQIGKSQPSLNLSESINSVPQGKTGLHATQNSLDEHSIHSEIGKLTSGGSSPYSHKSSESSKNQYQSYDYPPSQSQSQLQPQQLQQLQPQQLYQGQQPTVVTSSREHRHLRQEPQKKWPLESHGFNQNPPMNPSYDQVPKHILSPNSSQNHQAEKEPSSQGVPPVIGYQQHVPQYQKVTMRPYPPPSAQPNAPRNPQAPPQQQIYPQSLQFGYTAQVKSSKLTPNQDPRHGNHGMQPNYPTAGPGHMQMMPNGSMPMVSSGPHPQYGHQRPAQNYSPAGPQQPPGDHPYRNFQRGPPPPQNTINMRSYEQTLNPHVYYQAGIPPSINLTKSSPQSPQGSTNKQQDYRNYQNGDVNRY